LSLSFAHPCRDVSGQSKHQGELEKRTKLLEKRCKLLKEERELLLTVRVQLAGNSRTACVQAANGALREVGARRPCSHSSRGQKEPPTELIFQSKNLRRSNHGGPEIKIDQSPRITKIWPCSHFSFSTDETPATRSLVSRSASFEPSPPLVRPHSWQHQRKTWRRPLGQGATAAVFFRRSPPLVSPRSSRQQRTSGRRPQQTHSGGGYGFTASGEENSGRIEEILGKMRRLDRSWTSLLAVAAAAVERARVFVAPPTQVSARGVFKKRHIADGAWKLMCGVLWFVFAGCYRYRPTHRNQVALVQRGKRSERERARRVFARASKARTEVHEWVGQAGSMSRKKSKKRKTPMSKNREQYTII